MKTILVVDDDDAIVEALTEFLSGEGYRAVAASNSKDALAQLVKESPDLVLTDSVMPVVDGPSFVQRVHALPEFGSLPVVMMSASPEGVALSAATIGISAVLKKPFGLDELLGVIERLIGKSEA
jgi:two-component system phosphate regulon response regulator PhoB/two-component system alkaline phosphatase synthesis response regulator PhoP